LVLAPGLALVDGYQQYVLTRHSIRCGPRHPETQAKASLMAAWMSPRFLAGRDVLDLGGNAAFHSLWALQQGALHATVVDIDGGALENGKRAAAHVGIPALSVAATNVADWTEPADVVLALALVHWAYSCTALFGSASAFVERIASLTRYLAFVEWVAPADRVVAEFGHLEWNAASVAAPYTEVDFLASLNRAFARVVVVGDVSATRRVYAAFRVPNEIDLSGSVPKLRAGATLLASRNISRFRGMDHWSRVYADPVSAELTKQTSLDQAHREFLILSRIESPYFPKALREAAEPGGSSVVLETIDGVSLDQGATAILASPQAFASFVSDCLAILRALRDAGLQHRDIHAGNVMLRGGKPVLMDFGWAIAKDLPAFTPVMLGLAGRPADGSFCDVYSMGAMLRALKQDAFPEWNTLLLLMTEADARCRLTDLDSIDTLATICSARGAGRKDGDMDNTKQALGELADKSAALSDRASAQERRIQELEQELHRRQESVEALSVRLFGQSAEDISSQQAVLDSKEAAIHELRAVLAEKDRHIVGLTEAAGRVEPLSRQLYEAQLALAEIRGAQPQQAQYVAYLEKEVHAQWWRKAAAYVRRRLKA
jgi:serine/threonine protein kinase